jgi:hypothetical protein
VTAMPPVRGLPLDELIERMTRDPLEPRLAAALREAATPIRPDRDQREKPARERGHRQR